MTTSAIATTLPIAFYQTDSLEDVAAVTAGDGVYIVTIEPKRELAATDLGVPSVKTAWRFWKPVPGQARFQEAWQGPVAFPLSGEAVMAIAGGRLLSLALMNEPVPGLLVAWSLQGPTPPRPGERAEAHAVVELDSREAALVTIPPQHSWNTRTVQDTHWLFHPSMTSLSGGTQVAIGANTANGRASLWTWDGVGAPCHLASRAESLNPVLARIAGNDWLLFRRMPAGWSVFDHDLRYSGKFGPVALPLFMAALAAGDAAATMDLSKQHGLGDVFAFAAVPDGERLILATVGGVKATPELRVYAGSPTSGTLACLYSTGLRSVPYRLTMAVANKDALVGLAFTSKAGFEVEGIVVRLPK